MNIYQSPLCSCIICREIKSTKGIHSHFIIAHTSEGKINITKATKASVTPSALASTSKKLHRIEIYNGKPSTCSCCSINLSYKKRGNKFCSSSCSAKHNNTTRDYTNFKPGPKAKNKPKPACRKNKPTITRATFTRISFCIVCTKAFAGSKKTCSHDCLRKHMTSYSHPRNGAAVIYNGISLGSTYELKVAISLDTNNVKWIKPKPLLYTNYNNKIKRYYPDFYLPEYNVYLDPKNDYLINNINKYTGMLDSTKISLVEVQNNVTVLILDKHHLSWEKIRDLIVG
jgi:hypothetical protein